MVDVGIDGMTIDHVKWISLLHKDVEVVTGFNWLRI
jgi:hypothetical protein